MLEVLVSAPQSLEIRPGMPQPGASEVVVHVSRVGIVAPTFTSCMAPIRSPSIRASSTMSSRAPSPRSDAM
ncbi:hypothetical protein NKH52_30810 [Mesorhizobium sp. M1066]|uniref:hypothetical protein n=1 Tax=unclassified Mesorhizobium TaxID=325217 RepID=UPI00333544C8